MATYRQYIEGIGGFNVKEKGNLIKALDAVVTTSGVTPTAAPAALTNSTGQVGNDTVAQVANIALSTANTYTDAAVNAAVNTAIGTVNADLADLADKVNALRLALVTARVLT